MSPGFDHKDRFISKRAAIPPIMASRVEALRPWISDGKELA